MDTTAVASPDVKLVPVEQIQPSPYQARKNFDLADLQGLADSMKEEGQLQPIVVRPSNGSFQLISGERRYRAAKLLNWPTIEAKVVQTVSEADAAAKGLVENLQRQDLNPIEEAEGFDQLGKLDPDYWTQEKIARISGRTQGYISQSNKLLALPDPVKENIRRLIISRSHALELLNLPPEKHQEAADQVVKGGLSIKQTRQLVTNMAGPAKAAHSHATTLARAAVAPSTDLAWKGDTIVINRPFHPASESPETYIAWLTQALPAFAETQPVRTNPPQPPTLDVKPRLPANADEEKELQDIAAKAGPQGVYAWIFGAGSPMAQALPAGTTWEQLGMTAADGLRQVLAGIRQFQGMQG